MSTRERESYNSESRTSDRNIKTQRKDTKKK